MSLGLKIQRNLLSKSTKIPFKIPLQLHSLEGRYATAIYLAANKLEKLESVRKNLTKINSVIDNSIIFAQFLNDPSQNFRYKKKVLEDLFPESKFGSVVLNMLLILAENSRLSLTSSVINSFEMIMRAHDKISLIKVTSAENIGLEMKSTIESNIIALLTRADESPIIKFETDKSLVGGIIIQLGDRTLDLSTKKKLTELEKDLCNNSQSNI